MNRGEGKFYIILAVLIVAGCVYFVVKIGPVYQHKWKFGEEMEEQMRAFDKNGEERMIEDLIAKAKGYGLPPLTEDSFYFEGGTNESSLLQCEYTEEIQFPGGQVYSMKILIEKQIRIPTRAF